MSSHQFRFLLLASLVVGIVGVFVDFVFPALIPQPLLSALDEVNEQASDTLVFAIMALALLIALIASYIGLYKFRNWGRRCALWVTVASVIVNPFLGAAVQSGAAAGLLELSSVLWGAVIASSYGSTVAHEFNHRDA
jgi:O-antigen/teichoic acid export membrane protein